MPEERRIMFMTSTSGCDLSYIPLISIDDINESSTNCKILNQKCVIRLGEISSDAVNMSAYTNFTVHWHTSGYSFVLMSYSYESPGYYGLNMPMFDFSNISAWDSFYTGSTAHLMPVLLNTSTGVKEQNPYIPYEIEVDISTGNVEMKDSSGVSIGTCSLRSSAYSDGFCAFSHVDGISSPIFSPGRKLSTLFPNFEVYMKYE